MELLSAFPPLLSACNQPAYTNYVGGFHGCLDYIFIQPDSMQVLTLGSSRLRGLKVRRFIFFSLIPVNKKPTCCCCVLCAQVEQVIPLPSHQEITTYEALPSVAHPSDHIALICDLRWNP